MNNCPYPVEYVVGEIAALSAALLWAGASILFAEAGRNIRAFNLNIIKGACGSTAMLGVLLCGSLLGSDSITLSKLFSIESHDFLILCFSGCIGIALLFF